MMLRSVWYVVLGYLSGSVLYARVFAQMMKKEERLAQSRDGNPGAANAFVYGGFWCGLLTLCCDLLKGFLPVSLYLHRPLLMPEYWLAPVLAAPVLGHAFPVFFRFRGGKGIAVSFGCLLGLLPALQPAGALAASFLLFSLVLRISPHFYRTIAAYVGAAVGMALLGCGMGICGGFLLMTGVVCLRLHLSRERREEMKVSLLWMH